MFYNIFTIQDRSQTMSTESAEAYIVCLCVCVCVCVCTYVDMPI
jgi:hypothetical protein